MNDEHKPDNTNDADAPAEAAPRVRVPTRRRRWPDAVGGDPQVGDDPAYGEYVEADSDVAWQWDARRWERIS